jgi:hypothetical protein
MRAVTKSGKPFSGTLAYHPATISLEAAGWTEPFKLVWRGARRSLKLGEAGTLSMSVEIENLRAASDGGYSE